MAPALDDVGRHEGLFLKIPAITMMHEEHAMLAKWHDHYGRLVGPENPYVVSHGRDDRHREITPEASHITVPRDILKGFVGRRQRSLADLQKSLSPCYDAVRRVDVDELVFVDPACHDSLQDCFAATDLDMTDAWFALGFNLFAMDPEVSVDLKSPRDRNGAGLFRHLGLFQGRGRAVAQRRLSAWRALYRTRKAAS